MEQDKAVCASVGWQRCEDAISLDSLSIGNPDALFRACAAAAAVLYRSAIPPVQHV